VSLRVKYVIYTRINFFLDAEIAYALSEIYFIKLTDLMDFDRKMEQVASVSI